MTVTGNGPFEFTNQSGQQLSIPLVALQIKSGVVSVNATKWKAYSSYSAGDQAVITALLAEYTVQQQLSVAPAPSICPALIITAALPGTAGNDISVDIVVTPDPKTRDPTLAKMDITATEKHVFSGISVGALVALLGDGKATTGTQPSLATVDPVSIVPAGVPANGTNQNFSDPLDPTKFGKADILDASNKTVFTLLARNPGSDGKYASAAISDVVTVASATIFTLTLSWSHTVSGATLAMLTAVPGPMNYEILVQTPPSGIASPPASTNGKSIVLSGGTATTAASATAFTGN